MRITGTVDAVTRQMDVFGDPHCAGVGCPVRKYGLHLPLNRRFRGLQNCGERYRILMGDSLDVLFL
ncbi:hypothetical protein ABIA43_000246 [Bradyrhizobium sp. USDA 328]